MYEAAPWKELGADAMATRPVKSILGYLSFAWKGLLHQEKLFTERVEEKRSWLS
jgi:hypothetical protein